MLARRVELDRHTALTLCLMKIFEVSEITPRMSAKLFLFAVTITGYYRGGTQFRISTKRREEPLFITAYIKTIYYSNIPHVCLKVFTPITFIGCC